MIGRAALPLFCLAPRGVCRAALVARSAVGSYSTLSPLPVPLRAIGGLLSVALSVRRPHGLRPPFSRGALPDGVRTFLNLRLAPDCGRPGSGGLTMRGIGPGSKRGFSFRCEFVSGSCGILRVFLTLRSLA
jgi:hypothetical protein